MYLHTTRTQHAIFDADTQMCEPNATINLQRLYSSKMEPEMEMMRNLDLSLDVSSRLGSRSFLGRWLVKQIRLMVDKATQPCLAPSTSPCQVFPAKGLPTRPARFYLAKPHSPIHTHTFTCFSFFTSRCIVSRVCLIATMCKTTSKPSEIFTCLFIPFTYIRCQYSYHLISLIAKTWIFFLKRQFFLPNMNLKSETNLVNPVHQQHTAHNFS